MKQKFIAAAVQMVSGTDVAANLDRAAALVAEAAAGGAAFVVLPEYFCLMGRQDGDKVAISEEAGNGPLQTALAAMARDNKVWLAAGTIPLRSPEAGKVFNTTLVFDPDGVAQARYDKIHLFGYTGNGERYCESDSIVAGQLPVKVDIGLAEVACGICYDLRFPELFRQLAPFDVMILPAAFTATTGEAHWEVLMRARAIENQCFVIASGQGGTHENGRRTHGQSMIIDPWGRILAQQASGEGVVLAELDPALLQSVRSGLPALAHRVL
jgi:predicted amidohydrolase